MTNRIIILLFSTLVMTGLKAQTVDFTFTTANGLFCNPQTVSFTQACSGTPVDFIWDFGDGQTGSNATENIIYDFPGTYTVKLTAIYADNAISISKTVVINPTPTISLTADKNYLCQPGNIVFTAPGSPFITNYEWDFGDGSPTITTSNNTVSHGFVAYNSFTAKVKGTTATGCIANATYAVKVSKFGITGQVTPPSGCIPMNAALGVTTDLPTGDAPQNFLWDFGDGSPTVNGASASINHVYNTTANITTANVSITSVQGCTNQYTFTPYAYGTPPFGTIAKTVAARDTFCGSERVRFYGKATTANSYYWDFGDGTNITITDTIIDHKYKTLGSKRVILTPYFNGCAGTKDTVDIYIQGVIADYTYANTCGNKNTYAFTNQSLGNVDHFEWVFSDAPAVIDSANYNITHSFPLNGNFTSSLYLVDSITGCNDYMERNIFTAMPVFTRSTNAVCKDSLIVYQVKNTYPAGYGYSYEFVVNGISVNNLSDSVLSFHPTTFGNFTEYVVIRDNNNGTCNDSIYLSGPTQVRGPVVSFSAATSVCFDTAVAVINNSYPFFSTDNIIKWDWDFGDRRKDTVKNPLPHKYIVPSNYYYITLTATDINNCKQKYERAVFLRPMPRINVFPPIDTICLGETTMLRAYTADTLLWITTTNISCNNCDTVMVNPTVTTNYIARAVNIYGCKSYDTSLVKVYAPINLRVSPADTTVCPGNPIPYTLNTTGKVLWTPATFLNNDKIRNPVSRPDSAITYTVTVADSVGCFADTATAVVRLYQKPQVDAGPDLVLPYNTAYTLTPVYSSDVINYLWSPAADLSCSNCASPNGVALKKETYRIDAINGNGCKATDYVNVWVTCEQSNLLMPTAFTPNKDGKNDRFYPITRGYRIIKTFVVFNRLGNKVFERKDFAPNTPSLGWDGSVKGYEYGPNEVFVWYMEAECDAGQLVTTRGSVLVLH